MDYRAQLLALAEAYCGHVKRSEARIATLAASKGTFFANLRNGGGCTFDMFFKVQSWFASNWPEGLPWPDGVSPPGTLHVTASSPEAA